MSFEIEICKSFYQKFPFRRRIVPGRLHSELCARGVNLDFLEIWTNHFTKTRLMFVKEKLLVCFALCMLLQHIQLLSRQRWLENNFYFAPLLMFLRKKNNFENFQKFRIFRVRGTYLRAHNFFCQMLPDPRFLPDLEQPKAFILSQLTHWR